LRIQVVFARFVDYPKQAVFFDVGVWNHAIDLPYFERSRVIVVPNA
jgi:hypothetical protein